MSYKSKLCGILKNFSQSKSNRSINLEGYFSVDVDISDVKMLLGSLSQKKSRSII